MRYPQFLSSHVGEVMWGIDMFPHPPDRCIFCWFKPEDGKLTGEDFLPKWLARQLPKPKKYIKHAAVGDKGDLSLGLHHGLAHVDRATKLRVVCAACNNGWMSRLQNEVKPFLGPLALDGWTEPLDRSAQASLAKWAVMTTMVRQFDKPDSTGCPHSARDHFRTSGIVQPQWQVYLGRYEDADIAPKNHISFGRIHRSGLPGWRMTMTFVVGKVLFHTIYFALHDLPDANEYGERLGVRALEPGKAIISPPENPLTFRDVGHGVGSSLARSYAFRCLWFTDASCSTVEEVR